MTALTLKKIKTTDSVKTHVKIDATPCVVSIEAHLSSKNANLISVTADSVLKRTFGDKAQYRCESSVDKLVIEIMFTSTKELTFVQLCALEDATSCMLDQLQTLVDTTKSINHVVEDLYGTICNYYGKSKKPATPEKKTSQE